MKRTLIPLAALGLALAALVLALPSPSRPASAQRPTPRPPDFTQLQQYGTKLAIAIPMGDTDALSDVSAAITNVGREASGALVVALGQPAGSCPTATTGIVGYACRETLAPMALAELELPAAGTTGAVVYSLAPEQAGALCAGFEAVAAGRQTLAAWETTAWAPGAALAALFTLSGPAGTTGLAAEPSLAVAGIAGNASDRPGRGTTQLLLRPWPTTDGGQAAVMNMGGECTPLNPRVVAAGPGEGPCSAWVNGTPQQLPPMSAVPLPPASAPSVLSAQSPGEFIVCGGRSNDAGWLTFGNAWTSNQSGGVAFPLAVGPQPNGQSDLWVTNTSVTATAQVELVMFNGNQGLQRLYTDPAPLCPGVVRRYDVTELAGDIPPTAGRGDAAGPPLLSLRLQGTTPDTAAAPLLAGILTLQNGQGITGYAGQANTPATVAFQAAVRQLPGFAMWTVVPGVKKRVGADGRTTFLAVQTLGNPQAANVAYVDLYDAAGNQVASELPLRLGDGPGGFLDLGNTRIGVPDGFHGTAVVRAAQGRGAMAVVAMDRLDGPGRGQDVLATWSGVILPRWPEPAAPTATPGPTRDPGQATATAAVSATPVEATPTPDLAIRLNLPWASTGRLAP